MTFHVVPSVNKNMIPGFYTAASGLIQTLMNIYGPLGLKKKTAAQFHHLTELLSSNISGCCLHLIIFWLSAVKRRVHTPTRELPLLLITWSIPFLYDVLSISQGWGGTLVHSSLQYRCFSHRTDGLTLYPKIFWCVGSADLHIHIITSSQSLGSEALQAGLDWRKDIWGSCVF